MSDPALDGLARALAQPMPRRRAVRMMFTGLVAASFPVPASFAARRRRGCTGSGGPPCAPNCPTYKCCPTGAGCPADAYCCPTERECCPAGEVCLEPEGGGAIECCPQNQVCGNTCCPAGLGLNCRGGECVACEECEGESNRVTSVETASGDDLGLSGKQLCKDDEIVANEATKVRLGDGSVVTVEAGNGWKVRQCNPDDSIWDLIGDKIINLFAGDGKFNLQTDRAVIGVRGTEFTTTYDAGKKRTTVKVKSGKVQVWAKRNPKKKVTAGKGDTVIQQGNEAPKVKG